MAGIVKTNVQLGDSATATQNFTLTAAAADGTMKLARGNAGATTQDIITVDSSGLVTFSQGKQLTLGTLQNTTSGTAVDYTSIPSWVKRITVLLNGVSSASTGFPVVRLGTNSGISATGYSGAAVESFGTSSISVNGSTTDISLRGATPAASDAISGQVIVTNIAGTNWVWSGAIFVSAASNRTVVTSGNNALGAALTQLRITLTGGDSFDAGSVNILYEG